MRTFADMKKTDNPNEKPFPVRLGDIKPILQKEASENDRSLHYWIKKILSIHCKKENDSKP